MVEFDLNGRKARFDERAVRRLHVIARADAGSSTTLNDLAVILDRALTDGQPVTLRRAESRTFERLLKRLYASLDQRRIRRIDMDDGRGVGSVNPSGGSRAFLS